MFWLIVLDVYTSWTVVNLLWQYGHSYLSVFFRKKIHHIACPVVINTYTLMNYTKYKRTRNKYRSWLRHKNKKKMYKNLHWFPICLHFLFQLKDVFAIRNILLKLFCNKRIHIIYSTFEIIHETYLKPISLSRNLLCFVKLCMGDEIWSLCLHWHSKWDCKYCL